MSKRKQRPKQTARIKETILKDLLAVLPDDFAIESVSTSQISPNIVSMMITGTRLLRAFTVECLCMPQAPTARYSSLVSLPATKSWTKPRIRLGFCNNELRPHFEVLLDGRSSTIEIAAPDLVNVDTQVHLAGTFDSKLIKLYLDGKQVAETAAAGTLFAPKETVNGAIGSRSTDDPGDHFHGTMFYVRMWRIARSQEQICKLLKTIAPPPNPDPNASNVMDSKFIMYNLAYLSPEPYCDLWYPFSPGPYGPAGRPANDTERSL
jgi:hypothetical protein